MRSIRRTQKQPTKGKIKNSKRKVCRRQEKDGKERENKKKKGNDRKDMSAPERKNGNTYMICSIA